MADVNEQPVLLNQDLEESKKSRRPRTASVSKAKKATAKRPATRRPKRGDSQDDQINSEAVEHIAAPVDAEELSPPAERMASPEAAAPGVKVLSDASKEASAPHRKAEDRSFRERDNGAVGDKGAGLGEARAEEVQPASEPPKYEPVFGEGLIEVSGKGFGFLRDPKRNYTQSPQDIFVTPEVVRKHALRDGLWIKGEIRRGSRGPQLFKLTSINGEDPERYRNLPVFEELTSINPLERVRLETVPDRYTTRVMDLMTPIGKGQRGLIVAPPRTGKTTLLQHIANAVVKNHPEMNIIILLVDERPEEVTEIRRTVPEADIMASSNDSDIKTHTRIAQLAIERAKRLLEAGRDVFVLMDSLTRIGRAFNNALAGGGRTMSGGMDARAMEIPRKLFAAARNTEEAGSLTIMATALIETGSKMDELIFQEFKGTGNMEMVLDRQISDQRIYPAIDIFKSGTRREELLLPANDLEKINTIRRGLAGHRPPEAIERLLSFLKKFPTNSQMLREIPG
jgi:transcription termination factor Rho